MFPENRLNEYSVELLFCPIHKLRRIKEYLTLLICLLNNITERLRKGIICSGKLNVVITWCVKYNMHIAMMMHIYIYMCVRVSLR